VDFQRRHELDEQRHRYADNHRTRIQTLAPELLRFLRGERGPIATAEEGRTTLAMTLACYDAARTGHRVGIT
jgi:hypothetical protein